MERLAEVVVAARDEVEVGLTGPTWLEELPEAIDDETCVVCDETASLRVDEVTIVHWLDEETSLWTLLVSVSEEAEVASVDVDVEPIGVNVRVLE